MQRPKVIHVVWSCPVAATIRNSLSPALPPAMQISRAELCPLQAPPGIHSEVQSVVCAVAVEAGHDQVMPPPTGALSRLREGGEAPRLNSDARWLLPCRCSSLHAASDGKISIPPWYAVLHTEWWLSNRVLRLILWQKCARPSFVGIREEGERARLQLNLPSGVTWEGK